jgi:hypothetical protein
MAGARVLAYRVLGLALVLVELFLKAGSGLGKFLECACRRGELLTARGAGCHAGNWTDMLHNADRAFWHGHSFP